MPSQSTVASRRLRAHRAVAVILATLALSACSVITTQARANSTNTSTSTTRSYAAGVIQLRPVIPPKGAHLPTCPVGESLGTCTDQLDFSSWFRSPKSCPRIASRTNPPPDTAVPMMDRLTVDPHCVVLGPASFIVATAAKVITEGIHPLNGRPGIEIVLPAGQVASYDAAVGESFRKPLAIVANGQIVYILVPEPTNAQYQPMGGVLIFYGASGEIGHITSELRLESRAIT